MIVLSYAVAGNVLPITREQDYDAKSSKAPHSNYYGEPLRKQYDVHYAQLDIDHSSGT